MYATCRILSDLSDYFGFCRILSDLSDNDGYFWTVEFCRICQILPDLANIVGLSGLCRIMTDFFGSGCWGGPH